MNRLGIVVMYDADGIAYDYLLYYLNKLKQVCDKLILVVNGKICVASKNKCKKIVDDIYVRFNNNMDIGAYLDVIYNYISIEECIKYDEVVLANDTLFGPFKDFTEIFDKMKDKSCDVWGLNIDYLLYSSHIQSYFYCFRNKTIVDALKYWRNIKIPSESTKCFYIGAYELGLSNYLIENGKKIAAYSEKNGFNIFNTPYMALRYCNFPFLKKSLNSCSLKKEYIECNYMQCVDFIEETTEYPVQYITDYLKKKYRIDIVMKRENLSIKENNILKNRYEQFMNSFNKVYIYGMGAYGQMLFGMLGITKVQGFIVSSHSHEDEYCDKKVYCIEEVSKDSPILVAMDEKNTKEVRSNLIEYKNVCYLWE